jgi:CRISPR-associated protein Cas2
MIDEDEDSVYMFPICQKDFEKIEILGQAFDKAMANDELKRLFL